VAFILTPQLEQNVLKARLITGDNPMAIFEHPIALALLALSVASIIYLGPKKRKNRRLKPETKTKAGLGRTT
jgi:putative tricarboxylic transport membrane protein